MTLAGQLAFVGIMLELANIDSTAVGGVIQINPTSPIYKLVNSNMSTSTRLDRARRVPSAVRSGHVEPKPIAQSEGTAHTTDRRQRC